MILYNIYYKKRKDLFYKKIKKCKGDGIVDNGVSRYIILSDETRIEIPCHETIFKFSKERFFAVKERMESVANQEIKINKR